MEFSVDILLYILNHNWNLRDNWKLKKNKNIILKYNWNSKMAMSLNYCIGRSLGENISILYWNKQYPLYIFLQYKHSRQNQHYVNIPCFSNYE